MLKKRLLLIDGTYLLFRSFFAANSAKRRLSTSHLYFLSLIKLIKNLHPSHLLVAFDLKEKTWRHLSYDQYKANRPPAPADLISDMENIKELLDSFNILQLGIPGFEADDILASTATQFQENSHSYIFSKDQDLLQLVSENTSVLSDTDFNELTDEDNFFEKMGITPSQITDFKGLAGDNSDNLKGVAGIGKVTAKKLLANFQTLENIYENIDNSLITKSLREKLLKDKKSAFESKRLAVLSKNIDLHFSLKDLLVNIKITPHSEELCAKLELKYVPLEMKSISDSYNR